MKETALVIMAAGIGSRYGAGIKQLQKVGPHGEIIIDYSIYDALEAGFTKVIFIIRKEIEAEFKEVIGSRIAQICQVEYVFQEKEDLPEGFLCPPERTKPWGTGQAVLACRNILDVPFAVINADDYYGKEAFRCVYRYLCEHYDTKYEYCMAGFEIGNTLSENGTVTRGICKMDEDFNLMHVNETRDIVRTESGQIACEGGSVLADHTLVSMNMWGLTPEFIHELDKKFAEFLHQGGLRENKSEYLLPAIIDQMLQENKAVVKVLPTPDKWFGVTYAQDKEKVVQAFSELTAQGIYPANLWNEKKK